MSGIIRIGFNPNMGNSQDASEPDIGPGKSSRGLGFFCMRLPSPSERDVFLVAGKRTPIGCLGGELASVPAVTLGATAVRAALAAAMIPGGLVEECYFGCVLSANLGQAPARQVALLAGLSTSCCCTTVNKVCASGAKAIALAAQSIALGQADIVVAGGMESMSQAPYCIGDGGSGGPAGVHRVRIGGLRLFDAQLVDTVMRDGLLDASQRQGPAHPMGFFGDACAAHYAISREEQDAYTLESYTRAQKAWNSGGIADEIAPVSLDDKADTVVARDEEPWRLQPEKIPRLKPAFDQKHGTVTAANSSKISDGAAAVVLVSRRKAQDLGLLTDRDKCKESLARDASPPFIFQLIAAADAEREPEWFTLAPIAAIRKLFSPRYGLDIADIDRVDCWEINEAFSVVPLAAMRELSFIRPERLNMRGGAVSLGHPLGCSGARIAVTLMHVLAENQWEYGVAAICNGGGGATALLLRRVS
jgi:acetyl-CoA C-acetyltransferase